MKIETHVVPDYKKCVVIGGCSPQIAASLILGINPNVAFREGSPFDWRELYFHIKEVEDLCYVLCGNSALWWNYRDRSIFQHVDLALKNCIGVVSDLLEVIKEVFINYTIDDQITFIEQYPYLVKKLDLSVPELKQVDKRPPKVTLPESVRITLLTMIQGMARDGYGYDPSNARNPATGSKKGSIRAALQSVGLDLDEDTIRKYLTEGDNLIPITKPRNI